MRSALPLAAASLCSWLLACPASGDELLFVVADSSSLTSAESARKSQFESWGYTVSLISDGASQSSLDAAAALSDVAWVSPVVSASTLGVKLKNVAIGVVNEKYDLANEFGFSSTSVTTESRTSVRAYTSSHYIAFGWSTGVNTTIVSSSQTMARRTGSLASGAQTVARIPDGTGGYDPALVVLDVGGSLYGGGAAAGRRVLLPTASSTFSFGALNSSGLELYLESLEWAARPNPSIGSILLPVTSTSSPTTQEVQRRLLIDVWGYDVTLIDDDATQSSYNSAFTGKNAVYVCEEVLTGSIGAKLANCPIGVVNEDHGLADEFGIASANASTSVTAVSITDNAHYITSPFSTGSLTIFSASDSAGTISGTTAPGLRTLGTISGVKALAVVEAGGVLYTGVTAAGRRVELPWGGSTFDFANLNSNGKQLMRRAIDWAADPVGEKLLLVVANNDGLSAQEKARITLFESWNYAVNILDDGATQANFNLAAGDNNVAYISEEITSSTLGAKLRDAKIGIVSEEVHAVDEFEIASAPGATLQNTLSIVNGEHFITAPFGVGNVTIFSTGQDVAYITGQYASEMQVLGKWGSERALVVVEAGGRLLNGYTASGRRVQLPWGEAAFDFNALNANGQLLLQRALIWASGLIGHWRFDETSGTSAADSSVYGHNGVLSGGQIFSSHGVTGKLDRALDFNGSTHYVSVASTSTLQITDGLTIAAWIKGDAWGSGTDVDTILRKGEASPNNYQLSIASGRVEFLLDSTDNGGFKGNTTLTAGVWHHVAATWDGASVKIYVNGQLDNGAQSHSSPLGIDSRSLYLGGRSGADFFDGALDDVRLYNYALTQNEISKLRGLNQPAGARVVKWVEIQ